MSSSGRSNGSSGSSISKRPIDPITRTALRYTISPREYELLHQYLISRTPKQVQQQAPEPPRYEAITKSTVSGDYNSAAVRASLRVFAAVYVGFKGWSTLQQRLAARKGQALPAPATKNANLKLALSYSSILLFHRILHRFFKRLRASLLEDKAEPFRKRNPTVTRALTSQFTPAVGASLAGFMLGLSPSDQLRMTVAIYVFSRSLEFGYEGMVAGGLLWSEERPRPWWFGSWLMMPFACGQLLHAFVFDRDCFPESFGRFILARSPEYIQLRPKDYPATNTWPTTFDIVDALAELSHLRWPAHVSPILFPNKKSTLPSASATMAKIAPITGPAHPGTKHASCALLHPHDPSCARTYLKYWITAFPPVVKFFTLLYAGFALLAYKALLKTPLPVLNKLSARILRMSVFITGAIGTSWASICLFANLLPRSALPTQRWFLGGFLGGMWAFAVRGTERGNFLYSARLSVDSLYKVGKKRGWWRGVRNGDVLLFVASLALTNYVFEAQPAAVKSGMVRKALSTMKGQGWTDVVALAKKEAEKTGKEALGIDDEKDEKKVA